MPAKWTTRGLGPGDQPHHYFASSVGEWKVNTNLDKLIAQMKRSGYQFAVYRVDLPMDAAYKIEHYRPKVPAEQLSYVGFWEQVE